MVLIQLTGEITEQGELEIDLPKGLPAGKVQVTIETEKDEDLAWEERPWTAEELEELTRIEPKTGAEIVAARHSGGWEHYGITDSAVWVEEQRRKRQERYQW